MTELQTVARDITTAQTYIEAFGVPSNLEKIDEHIKRRYRQLARILHPDLYKDRADKDVAEGAFRRLGSFKKAAETAAMNGSYGKATALATIATRRGVHKLLRSGVKGAITATYWAESKTDSGSATTFCKIARTPRDNDLLQNEATILRRLHGKDVDPIGAAFVPALIDSFAYSETKASRRQANVMTGLEGFYTLQQLVDAFPAGFDPLHMVWIWRRLLVAIDHAHRNQVVHGAVLPEHIMVLPKDHGVMLTDWCYGVIADEMTGVFSPIKAVVGDKRQWYPSEVLDKRPPGPATDIAMAARCMVWLTGGDPATGVMPVAVPRPLRAFFKGCLSNSSTSRPQDAWLLLKEFDELLESMGAPYYPRRFRPLVMPTA